MLLMPVITDSWRLSPKFSLTLRSKYRMADILRQLLALTCPLAAGQECRRVSGAGRRTKPGQVRPATVWVIAMGFSAFGVVARGELRGGWAALALLRTLFLGRAVPMT